MAIRPENIALQIDQKVPLFRGYSNSFDNTHKPSSSLLEKNFQNEYLKNEYLKFTLVKDKSLSKITPIFEKSLPQLIKSNPRTQQWQILASAETGNGVDEFFATPFGRDLMIALFGLADAVEHGAKHLNEYLEKGITALEEIERYQALEDDPERGMQRGAILHEIRFSSDKRFLEFKNNNWPIFSTLNEQGEVIEEKMINYDASETTHMYVALVMKLERMYPGFANQRQDILRRACDYILRNSDANGGLAGFTNDLPWVQLEEEAEAYGGLSHKGSKNFPNDRRKTRGLAHREARDENGHAFENGYRPKPGEPIYGFQTTAIKFAAEMEAADYYERIGDQDFAKQLRNDALQTKRLANSENGGFLRYDRMGKPYYVELIAVNPESDRREQIPYVTASPLYALAYTYAHKDELGELKRDQNGGVIRESVIDEKYLEEVIDRMENELFQDGYGLATYSPRQTITFPKGFPKTRYWVSEGQTFWWMENYLAANGAIDLGYESTGLTIGVTANRILAEIGSPAENCVKDEKEQIIIWQRLGSDGKIEQESGYIQAFTVGPGLAFIARVNNIAEQMKKQQEKFYVYAPLVD